MILNGQHCQLFSLCTNGINFKINSVPDSSHEASHLDVFVDKLTQMVMFLLLSCDVLGGELP